MQSLDILLTSSKSFECRTTCDPRLLTVDDIFTIALTLKEKGVKEYYLQKYRPIPTDKNTTEEECLALIENKELIDFLQKSFAKFEVRK